MGNWTHDFSDRQNVALVIRLGLYEVFIVHAETGILIPKILLHSLHFVYLINHLISLGHRLLLTVYCTFIVDIENYEQVISKADLNPLYHEAYNGPASLTVRYINCHSACTPGLWLIPVCIPDFSLVSRGFLLHISFYRYMDGMCES